MGKSSQPTQTVQLPSKQEPWGPSIPYIMHGLSEAQRIYNQPRPSPFMWAPPQSDERLIGNQLMMNYLFGSQAPQARDPIYDPGYGGTMSPYLKLLGMR